MSRTTKPRARRSSRRAGYTVAALLNGAVIYAVHGWPGWEAVPFLTPSTEEVLGPLTFSLALGILVNVAFVIYDDPWFKALGDIFTAAVSLWVTVRIWQVFPFDFGSTSFDWDLVVRVLLAVGIAGTALSILVNLVALLRGAPAGSRGVSAQEGPPSARTAGRGPHANGSPASGRRS